MIFLRCFQVLMLFFVIQSSYTFAQDSLAPNQQQLQRIPLRIARNPVLLANRLTENATTDKQKFDAILTWVTARFRYHRGWYNNGAAINYQRSVKSLLRKRRGNAFDYAKLMDTLCSLAGLDNMSVFGYQKDVYFDINDSLYINNHAWNAVKLNGFWHLYDASMIRNQYFFDHTKCSKRRMKWVDSLSTKTVIKIRTIKSRRIRKSFCQQEVKSTTYSYSFEKIRFGPQLLIYVIELFPYRSKLQSIAVANSPYYLANPDYFSLTHFPIDSSWAFTQRILSVKQFSADSGFYYRSQPTFDTIKTQRRPTFCLSCDQYASSDRTRQEQIKLWSNAFHSSNHFVPALFHSFAVADLFPKVIEAVDSLTKFTLYDSVIVHYNQQKIAIHAVRKDLLRDKRTQSEKNKSKKQRLIAQNKALLKNIDDLYGASIKKRNRIRNLESRSNTSRKRQLRDLKQFKRAFENPGSVPKIKPEILLKMQAEVEVTQQKTDSLTRAINRLKEKFVTHADSLNWNIRSHLKLIYPLNQSFLLDGNLRRHFLLDQNDLSIQVQRKTIDEQVKKLISTVQQFVLNPSDSVYNELILVNNLIHKRNLLYTRNAKLLLKLSLVKAISDDSLQRFQLTASTYMKDDICWNDQNKQITEVISRNFKLFLKQFNQAKRWIDRNNFAEIKRFKVVDSAIQLHYKRYINTCLLERKRVDVLRKKLSEHRQKELKKLRDARLKAG